MRAIFNIGDLTQKWVFGRAKQGLRKDGILNTKFGLKLGETVEKEKRRGRGRRRREEEESRSSQQGMELWILYGNYPWLWII